MKKRRALERDGPVTFLARLGQASVQRPAREHNKVSRVAGDTCTLISTSGFAAWRSLRHCTSIARCCLLRITANQRAHVHMQRSGSGWSRSSIQRAFGNASGRRVLGLLSVRNSLLPESGSSCIRYVSHATGNGCLTKSSATTSLSLWQASGVKRCNSAPVRPCRNLHNLAASSSS